MKKQEDKLTLLNEDGEMLDLYDLDYSKGKPNRFADRMDENSVMVVLDPDIAAVFPTAEAVNDALRVMVQALRQLPNTTTI